MKCAILLSGGKDSVYAAYLASSYFDICGAICIKSLNSESYMFHTPNINWVRLQAESMHIPLIMQETQGVKEEELADLKSAIAQARDDWGVECIITGAVASQYQASRVQKICHELGLWCNNPLWQIDQVKLLQELNEHKFTTIISGVFAYPFDDSLLGARITPQLISRLKDLQEKFQINPAGEGGEIETFVTDCPLFSQKLEITQASKEMDSENSGLYRITEMKAVKKDSADVTKHKTKTPLAWEKQQSKNVDVCIISCVAKDKELFEWEYIRPVVDVCKQENKTYSYIHLEDVSTLPNAKKIIISGTALKDNNFLKHQSQVKKLLEKDVAVLGICAGAELMALHYGEALEKIHHIGPVAVQNISKDPLCEALSREEYFLHQQGFTKENIKNLDVLATITDTTVALFKHPKKPHYGAQFHPELNTKKLIAKFLEE